MSNTAPNENPVLQIGHLREADKDKIATIPITEGNVIYSEAHQMQFVDYGTKRHVSGAVISASFSGTTYKDFSTLTAAQVLSIIKSDSDFADGQLIKIGDKLYQYRKTDTNAMLLNIGQQLESRIIDIHISGASSGSTTLSDNIECILSCSGKIIYATIGANTNGVVEFLTAESIDDTVSELTMNSSFTVQRVLYQNGTESSTIISCNTNANFRVISYSLKNSFNTTTDYVLETYSIAAMETL